MPYIYLSPIQIKDRQPLPRSSLVILKNKIIVYCLLSVVCGLISGCITTEYNVGTHKQDIIFYSTEREIALGQNIAKKVASEFKVSSNPYFIEKVNKIGKRIAAVCDRKELSYYFYVIEDKERNAFSLPGGYVYIYKGILDLLDEEELAFVLAHEIGHIVSRHSVKRLQSALGYNLLILASAGASSDPQFTRGLSYALGQIISGYSRQDEFNADELAVKYCRKAGFNPRAGIGVLEKLYQEDKKIIRPLSYFRTHPYTAPRIRHIKETLHLPLSVEDYINY